MSKSFVLEHATGHSCPAMALTAVRYVKMECVCKYTEMSEYAYIEYAIQTFLSVCYEKFLYSTVRYSSTKSMRLCSSSLSGALASTVRRLLCPLSGIPTQKKKHGRPSSVQTLNP